MPADGCEEILAVFEQRTLFRHLHTLRISPDPSAVDLPGAFDALGVALAKLPALTALELGLYLEQGALSEFVWQLPLLRRLRIGSDYYTDTESIAGVPVVRAPNLEVFEVTDMRLDTKLLHRVFGIAIASSQLKSLTIGNDYEATIFSSKLATAVRAARWPQLTEVNFSRIFGVEAPGLLEALAERAPALRVLDFYCRELHDAETNRSLRGFASLERARIAANRCVKMVAASTTATVPSLKYLKIDVDQHTLSGLAFPGLHTLHLERHVDLVAVDVALASCPALHTLIADCLDNADRLSTRSWTNVRRLKLRSHLPREGNEDPAILLLAQLPSLSALSVAFAHSTAQWCTQFAEFVERAPLKQLSTLQIKQCQLDSLTDLKRIVSALPSLRHLSTPAAVFNELRSWFASQGRRIERAENEHDERITFTACDWDCDP